jgi:hypothetical protein
MEVTVGLSLLIVTMFWLIGLILEQTAWFNWLSHKMFGKERGELEWLDNLDGVKIIKRRKK